MLSLALELGAVCEGTAGILGDMDGDLQRVVAGNCALYGWRLSKAGGGRYRQRIRVPGHAVGRLEC